jgi:hypothetical protein
MSNRQILADSRVDAFITAVNASPKAQLSCDGIPEPCRLPEMGSDGACGWRIVRSETATWMAELESTTAASVAAHISVSHQSPSVSLV